MCDNEQKIGIATTRTVQELSENVYWYVSAVLTFNFPPNKIMFIFTNLPIIVSEAGNKGKEMGEWQCPDISAWAGFFL